MIERKLIGEKRLFLTSVIIAYKNFSLSYEERRERSVGERHILLLAFSGALILFLANVPVQLVRFSTSLEVERGLYIGLLGFVSVFFLPLLLYFVSGVISTGQSGHFLSSHYDDQSLLWQREQYIPITYDILDRQGGSTAATIFNPTTATTN